MPEKISSGSNQLHQNIGTKVFDVNVHHSCLQRISCVHIVENRKALKQKIDPYVPNSGAESKDEAQVLKSMA